MKRDAAVTQAREQLAATGIPQSVRMSPDGEWNCRPVTELRNRCGDCGVPVDVGADVCFACSMEYRREDAEAAL